MRVSNMIRVFILIFSVFLFSLVLAKLISPPKTLAAIVCEEHYLDFNSGCYNNLCTSTSRQFKADCTEISALCRAMGKFCDRYTGAQCCQLTHGAATTCTSIDNSDLCFPGGPADGIRCCWDDGNPVPPPPTPTPTPFNCVDQGGLDYECFSGCPANWVPSVQNSNPGGTTCGAQICCWFNPPATPTPIPSCSSYTDCTSCVDAWVSGGPFCGWGGVVVYSCQDGTSSACPASYTRWNWTSCSVNECAAPPTPTPTGVPPTPTPTPTGVPPTPTPTPIPGCKAVKGHVWIDSNDNCARDPGETGFNGVDLFAYYNSRTLLDATDTSHTDLAQCISGQCDGYYSLVNLCSSLQYDIIRNIIPGYTEPSVCPGNRIRKVDFTIDSSPATRDFFIVPLGTPTPTGAPTPTIPPGTCGAWGPNLSLGLSCNFSEYHCRTCTKGATVCNLDRSCSVCTTDFCSDCEYTGPPVDSCTPGGGVCKNQAGSLKCWFLHVSGLVFVDTNENGVKDGAESAFNGGTSSVVCCDSYGNPYTVFTGDAIITISGPTSTTTTNRSSAFQFTELVDYWENYSSVAVKTGEYIVTITPPSGYIGTGATIRCFSQVTNPGFGAISEISCPGPNIYSIGNIVLSPTSAHIELPPPVDSNHLPWVGVTFGIAPAPPTPTPTITPTPTPTPALLMSGCMFF